VTKSVRFSLLVVLLLLLSACATGLAPTPYWEVKESSLSGLKAEVTTKDEVLKQVGTPSFTAVFPNQGVEVWDYRYLEGTTIRMIAYVHFDLKGVYKYTSHAIDPVFHLMDGGY